MMNDSSPLGHGHRWPRSSRTTFLEATLAALAVQQGFVALVLRRDARRHGPHRLNLIDLMTLSRGGVAALLAGLSAASRRDRKTRWIGWLAILYGAILCDWLDGPLSRREGASWVGAVLDLEADSWLTLWTGLAAVSLGNLPAYAALPPVARYAFLLAALRRTPYARLQKGESPWVRRTGILQMLLFLAALAPFKGRYTHRVVALATPIIVPLQLLSLALQYGRRRP